VIKIKLGIELRYDIAPPGSDLIFNIHAAHTRQQMITQESLQSARPSLRRSTPTRPPATATCG
jgi:hypothetical protein